MEAKLESSNFEYIAGSEIVGHFGGGGFLGKGIVSHYFEKEAHAHSNNPL
jgi:hypothetical protein